MRRTGFDPQPSFDDAHHVGRDPSVRQGARVGPHRSTSRPLRPRPPKRSRSHDLPKVWHAWPRKSYIGGTTPLPNRTAPLSNVPSACFSVGTKTVAPGVISLLSVGTTATIGTFVGMTIFFSPPL